MNLLLEVDGATFTSHAECCEVSPWNSNRRCYSKVIVTVMMTLTFKDGQRMVINSESMADNVGRRVVSAFSQRAHDRAYNDICDLMRGYFTKLPESATGMPWALRRWRYDQLHNSVRRLHATRKLMGLWLAHGGAGQERGRQRGHGVLR